MYITIYKTKRPPRPVAPGLHHVSITEKRPGIL